ncbi:MAG: acetylornithine/succinylornithine family transaminase [Planctomycetes bacterium]|nr:acetylornithine/succinylornithine family transaminase [Planctomycetota bacterium]
MTGNYPRYPIAIVRGRGAKMWDAEGKEYLDLFAGFGAGVLGHCHPDLVKAVTDQANLIWHAGNLLYTEPQTHLAEAIFKHGFGGRSFFCHSGADANEAAFKLARLYGKAKPGKIKGKFRYKIVSAINSFHGRSFATMMATGQEKVRHNFEPFLAGFSNVPYNDLEAMKKACDDETIAVIVEPIQGEGGINIPDDAYITGLRKLCDERDMVLIFDEVWTGCGRTGKYFAHQHWDVKPDIMTLAKGVGGGLAVGVMCAGPRVAELYDSRKQGIVAHATTLGGNCVSMAAAAAVFRVIERDNLLAHAAKLGNHAMERVRRFAAKDPRVKAVRGKGLFIGIELNPQAPGAWFKSATEVVNKCLDRGLLINGTQNTVLRLAPSLVVTQAEMDQGLDLLERTIRGE